jgi:hypothetical protein
VNSVEEGDYHGVQVVDTVNSRYELFTECRFVVPISHSLHPFEFVGYGLHIPILVFCKSSHFFSYFLYHITQLVSDT